jgi:hypothetical protein
MSTKPWMKFYPADHFNDKALRLCSLAAQGLWLRMLCIMHEAKPYGHLLIGGQPVGDADLSELVGKPVDQIGELLGELDRRGVFSRTQKGVIYSRRMIRDDQRANEGRKAVNKRWGNERSRAEDSQHADNVDENPGPNRYPTSPPTPPPITQILESRKTPYSPPPGDVSGNGQGNGPDFDEFWGKYPSRGDAPHSEKGARTAFDTAVKSGVDPSVLIAAALAYAAYCRKERVKPKFILAAATFLRNGTYQQYAPKRAAPGGARDRDKWRAPLRKFAETGGKIWNHGFGPRPDERGCGAPADLIAEYLGEMTT